MERILIGRNLHDGDVMLTRPNLTYRFTDERDDGTHDVILSSPHAELRLKGVPDSALDEFADGDVFDLALWRATDTRK